MKIKLLKQIVFRDENGAIQAQYSIGDILEVSRFNGSYFVFSIDIFGKLNYRLIMNSFSKYSDRKLKRAWSLGLSFQMGLAPWFADLCKELSERKLVPWN